MNRTGDQMDDAGRIDGPHPAPPRLEAMAAGDDETSLAAHVEACEVCAVYVARLKEDAAAFRARVDPAAFGETIRAREAASRPRRGLGMAWVGAPAIAIAAATLLWLRAAPEGGIARVPSPAASPVSPTLSPADDGRFKGGLSVAVVRERGGAQERLTGPFEVRPFDRIRVEIALDHEEPITAGLLADDGTWTMLEAPATLSVGTHYSELAARFDESPTSAFLLVGSPVDVARARSVGSFDGVVAWRVTTAAAKPGRP